MFGSFGMNYALNPTKATPPETSTLPCNKRVKTWVTQVRSIQIARDKALIRVCVKFSLESIVKSF